MITDFELLTAPVPDFSNHTSCLDRLINFGSLKYNPKIDRIDGNFVNDNVGLYLIHSNVFPRYLSLNQTEFPVYPTLNRGIANGVSRYVYDNIKLLYAHSKQQVSVDYNSVNFNLTRGGVYKHSHVFASPDRQDLDTQVFVYRLTNFAPGTNVFKLHVGDHVVERSLDRNCTFRFNGILEHEVVSDDTNYHGYFVFEKWPE
jgi:hypothetical protein